MQKNAGHGYADNQQHTEAGTDTASSVHEYYDAGNINQGMNDDLCVKTGLSVVNTGDKQQAGNKVDE